MENTNFLKLKEKVAEAERVCGSADHLVSVTYPVVNEAKLLMNGFESLHRALTITISTILQIESCHKRIHISSSPGDNLQTFFNHSASRYGLNEDDIVLIKEMFMISKKHKDSGIEFSKSGKRIIMDDNSKTFELDALRFKKYLQTTRKALSEASRMVDGMLERYK